MDKIMAVLTGERAYGERLCAYANYKRGMPFTAVSFDSGHAYENFASKHRIGVLLTDGHVEKKYSGFREKLQDREDMIIGLLDETDEDSIFNYSEAPAFDTYALIPKYQSAEKIMRSVMSCCSSLGVHICRETAGSGCYVAGVYSPSGRSLKAAYSMALAKALGSMKRTLFISFEEFSGFSRITGECYGGGLSDAMLAHKKGCLDSERIGSLIYTYCGIEYIPPIQYAEDMKGISGEELAQMIGDILEHGSYEAIVLDLPDSFNMAEDMMDICDEIFMPENDDQVSAARTDEFLDYLAACKKLRLRSKLCRFKMRPYMDRMLSASYVEDLIFGELGDLAREHVRHLRQ